MVQCDMTHPSYDLLIRTVTKSIAIRGDRIVALDSDITEAANQAFDFPEGILLPGLIDLHAHPARSGSVFGVDPDSLMLSRGVTTVMSQGDAGADNIDDFVRDTIRASRTRVLLAVNLSRVGESTEAGCFTVLDNADANACVSAIEKHRQHTWGIAVNVSHHACGTSDPREVLKRGLAAARQADVPILYGMRRPSDWPLAEQLKRLRPGDVVTYCYRREPHCIVERGHVLPEILDARDRGIRFDVGHGGGSFDFEVAEAAIRDRFAPDTISSDLHVRHLGQTPQHDLPLVMSKLKAAGMTDDDVFRAVTSTPASVLGLASEIGSLIVGRVADVTVLQWRDHAELLYDTSSTSRSAGRWEAVLTVRSGDVV